jgi:carbon-monoxide dehydrogenase medium subunit
VSVEDALTMLRDGEAKILAGGQSLLPVMNLRLSRPEAVIDLGALPELERLFEDADSLVLGALVRHRTLELDPAVARRQPLLAAAAAHIGHVGIRNRGTLGGTLAHADPAAELPLVTAVLDATAYVESRERGRREVPVRHLFSTYFTTVLEPDEILTWIRVPALAPGEGWGFHEYARRHGDFAIAGAAATLRLDSAGRVARLRAGALAAGEVPAVFDGEAIGERPTDELWDELARSWSETLRPAEDPDYTRHIARVALRRAMTHAAARAAGGQANE